MLGNGSATQRLPSLTLALDSVHPAGSPLLTCMLPMTGAVDPGLCELLASQPPVFSYTISLNPVTLREVGGILGLSDQRGRHSLGVRLSFLSSHWHFAKSLPHLNVQSYSFCGHVCPPTPGCQDWSPDSVCSAHPVADVTMILGGDDGAEGTMWHPVP